MHGSSEGGSAVFKLDYMGTPTCLAQPPQLHKQMAICADFYDIGPVFRAEQSLSHRHLCEFVGLDVEMEIKEQYSEVMDVVDDLFASMFNIEEWIKMLEEAGFTVDPLGDLSPENDRKLGELVKENYDTEFYILRRYRAPPHGDFGVGLELVVMLFCTMNNKRKISFFLCDPNRLAS
ncbi:OLC1v1012594C1 [Oldenlandia corymbosa var. corymbosa]|uniref:OLC1v1012594C1 n=1 Tax=Oldenlandia corymbosa var. corymbosa TaxID=529605 RepID=A0AAV1DZN8_OLDCO|nr:OLC1v1012594C1 [Oldenlandia corymbosa var. corymbosa]